MADAEHVEAAGVIRVGLGDLLELLHRGIDLGLDAVTGLVEDVLGLVEQRGRLEGGRRILLAGSVIDRPDQARIARVQSDLAVLQNALQLYKLDNLRYPTTEQGLSALVERPTRGPEPANWAEGGYIDRLPSDPWGGEYQYLSPGVNGEVDVFTFGADGVTGGDGIDADLGPWSFE